MPKQPLPLNPSPLPDLPPLPPNEPSKPLSPLDQPPVLPLAPVPWNIHRRDYSSMEMYQEPIPVENPLEDPDSPMEDAPPLEPKLTQYPGKEGELYILDSKEPPIPPWVEYHDNPPPPVSHKHSLSPTMLRSWALTRIFRYFSTIYFALSVTRSPLVFLTRRSDRHQIT